MSKRRYAAAGADRRATAPIFKFFPALEVVGTWVVERFGSSDPAKVAITFDDGPDPKHTRRVLDILDEHDVKATFFVIGRKVEEEVEVTVPSGDKYYVVSKIEFI